MLLSFLYLSPISFYARGVNPSIKNDPMYENRNPNIPFKHLPKPPQILPHFFPITKYLP